MAKKTTRRPAYTPDVEFVGSHLHDNRCPCCNRSQRSRLPVDAAKRHGETGFNCGHCGTELKINVFEEDLGPQVSWN